MKSLMKFLLALGVTAAAANAALAQVELSIGSASVTSGGVATVDLDISGLPAGGTIGDFDLTVGFNSSLLSVNSALYGSTGLSGDQLNPGGPTQGFDAFTTTTGNTLEVAEFSLAASLNQPSSFTLATLSFNTTGSGTSPLALGLNALADQFGETISDVALATGSIAVSAVSGGGGGGTAQAPEIDPTSAMSGLTLLLGSLLVLRGRRVVKTAAGG